MIQQQPITQACIACKQSAQRLIQSNIADEQTWVEAAHMSVDALVLSSVTCSSLRRTVHVVATLWSTHLDWNFMTPDKTATRYATAPCIAFWTVECRLPGCI